MSDVNPEPRPGQVFALRRDQHDPAVVLVRPVRDRWWLAYDLGLGALHEVMLESRNYLREATPAERKAAGLPEEPIGCAPTMADLKAVRAERDSAAKRVAELEAQVDALTKERDRARNDSRVNAEAWGVKCDEVLAVKARAEKAEAALESLKARSHDAYLAWQAEKAALAAPRCSRCGDPVTLMQSQLPDEVGLPCHKNCPTPAPPAPSLDALTAAEVAYVRAAISFHAATAGFSGVLEAAKRAAKGVK